MGRRLVRHGVLPLFLLTLAIDGRLVASEKPSADRAPLPSTQTLEWTDDIASRMVDGIDRFLLSQTGRAIERRAQFWHLDRSSWEKYRDSIEPNRLRLAHILGVRDPRVAFTAPELVGTTAEPALVGRGAGYEVFVVRWPVFGDVHGEGLLLVPTGKRWADVVAIPDADTTPEMLAGLVEGVSRESQFARRLAESGCRVLVPMLINRNAMSMYPQAASRKIPNREFLYRSAFVLGRHLIGYEVQKVLAGVDWFSNEADHRPMGVFGWGEGALLALYAGALDRRIGVVGVSGYFDSRQDLWREPLDRNVFGLLERFGDAELAAMVAPRRLVIEASRGRELEVAPGTAAGPGRLVTPQRDNVRREIARARSLLAGLQPDAQIDLVESGDGQGPYGSPRALQSFLDGLATGTRLAAAGPSPQPVRSMPDAAARHARQMHELDRHNQELLAESPAVRERFFTQLDTRSPDAFQKTIKPYREFFYDEVIGRFDDGPLPPNPRTRKTYEGDKWVGYEVVLDVFPDVFAYGVLLVPKEIKPGERRPVVVCQHGLEGQPTDVFQGKHRAYHDFAAHLADRGFVTFAPQNPYRFGDRFRTLQRKANPIKKSLFSIIVPQHQQTVDWLASLPFVDPQRIAFYGLSYGGKTAMRVPPLVRGYCLSICSGDFNEWVAKNASTRLRSSYVWTGEYEIFEFDLGSTFNYAEMAALIAPRPFMVERGHFDGVGSDEAVAHEFAKVRFLYEARLKLRDRCRIEWFDGPHTINGQGTFDFLHEYLAWPKPAAK